MAIIWQSYALIMIELAKGFCLGADVSVMKEVNTSQDNPQRMGIHEAKLPDSMYTGRCTGCVVYLVDVGLLLSMKTQCRESHVGWLAGRYYEVEGVCMQVCVDPYVAMQVSCTHGTAKLSSSANQFESNFRMCVLEGSDKTRRMQV